MSDFVHLHVHSQYSLLEGAITLEALCQRVKEWGMKGCALTDAGNMFGAVEFFELAKAAGIKPVFGAEVYYLTAGGLESREKRKDQFLANLVLLVQDATGYKNLCHLLSLAHLKGFYYKPRIDKETLRQHSQGLVALSGTLHGEVHRRLLKGEGALAEEAANFLQETFQDRLYLELQDHDLPQEKKIYSELVALSQRRGIPFVATNDCRYLESKDAEAHMVLQAIQTGRTLQEEEERAEQVTDQKYLKPTKEMHQNFKSHPEAIENTLKIFESCQYGFYDKKYYFPHFQPPEGKGLDAFLESSAREGLEKLWGKVSQRFKEDERDAERESYQARLEEELKIITQMGFAGYFLIVADFINFAKGKGIPVGPGRGSAAGSLVAFALGITDIDPMPYFLLFERFLNPERISMPDMDIDFCMNGRDEVIRYVREKYGHVSQIITFGKMKAKAVIRDVGRVLDLPYGEVDKIAKLVPNTLNITLADALKQEPRLEEMQKGNAQVSRLMQIARSLEGLTRHASMHAAGVVIADRPLSEFCPLYQGPDNEAVTQYDMKAVEKIGLVKFDFLGLKTLTVIDVALKIIKRTRGREQDIREIPLDDAAVYQQLCSGDGLAIFQLESSGMRDLLTRLKPNCFEDIIALVALYRPGPLGSGMVDDFINRKHGKTEISYDLEQLGPILQSTYGVIVYQEQVMQIASALASFTLGDADLLRRAMGKKKPEEMAKQRERFLQGAAKNKIPAKKAEKIFDLMAKFAEYGFNKSHSAAYALVSYQTAYLKTHFTVEYMASVLTHEMGNTDKILIYINDSRERGIKVLPPDVNESFRYFSVQSADEIRFGLAAVKGVGEAAIGSIIETRKAQGPFTSIFDFCSRVDLRKVNKKVVESLVKCGAFDSIHPVRSSLFASLDRAMDWGANRQKESQLGQTSVFDLLPAKEAIPQLPKVPEWPDIEKLAFEKEALGFYITGHPLRRYQDQIKRLANFDTQKCQKAPEKSEVGLCGMVTSYKEITTRKGARMAFVTLEDLVGTIEVVVFSDVFAQCSTLLQAEVPLYVKGTVDHNEDTVKILAKEVLSLDDMRIRKTKAVHLKVHKDLMSKTAFEELKGVLERHSGSIPAFLHLHNGGGEETVLALPPDLEVAISEAFISDVERLLGASALALN